MECGMYNFSQWIGLWNWILFFREANCGMGIIIPKSTAKWIRIFEKQCREGSQQNACILIVTPRTGSSSGGPSSPNTTGAGLLAPHRTLTFATGSQPSCPGNQAGVLGSREGEEPSSKENGRGFITGPGPGCHEILTSHPPSAAGHL